MKNRIKSLMLLLTFGIISQNSLAISSSAQTTLKKLFGAEKNTEASISKKINSAAVDQEKYNKLIEIVKSETSHAAEDNINKAINGYIQKCKENFSTKNTATNDSPTTQKTVPQQQTGSTETTGSKDNTNRNNSQPTKPDGNSPDTEKTSWLRWGLSGMKKVVVYPFVSAYKAGEEEVTFWNKEDGEEIIQLTIPGAKAAKTIVGIPFWVIKAVTLDYTTIPMAKLIKLIGYDYTTKPFAKLAYNHKKKVIAVIMIIIAAEIADQALNNGAITSATYDYLTQGLGWTKEQIEKLVESVKEQLIGKQFDELNQEKPSLPTNSTQQLDLDSTQLDLNSTQLDLDSTQLGSDTSTQLDLDSTQLGSDTSTQLDLNSTQLDLGNTTTQPPSLPAGYNRMDCPPSYQNELNITEEVKIQEINGTNPVYLPKQKPTLTEQPSSSITTTDAQPSSSLISSFVENSCLLLGLNAFGFCYK